MRVIDGFTADQESAAASRPLDSEAFAKRAAEVLDTMHHLRQDLGLSEAVNVVTDRFVDDEPQPQLRRLAEVLARARRAAVLQERLDDDRDKLHNDELSHAELVVTGHHYEMLRHEACEYNHLLRGLIESCGHYFSRDALMKWLSSASQGRAPWAKGEVTGAISEIALHAALQGMSELRDVRYATVAEDLAGYDFVASWQGRLVTMDAKTGFYRPLNLQKRGHRHLEISVPKDAVKDFGLTRRGLDHLRADVRRALLLDAQPAGHVAHHYFAKATVSA